MEFKPTDFKGLMFNIFEVSEKKSLADIFPQLFAYDEFKKEIPFKKDKVIRYIIYVYDKNSPLHKETHLTKRKQLALDLAGFNKKDDDCNILTHNKLPAINAMIIRYIRLQRDIDYSTLMAIYENYYNTLNQVVGGEIFNKDGDLLKDSEMKGKLSKQLVEQLEDIKNLTNKVFHGDNELLYSADEINSKDPMSNVVELYATKIKHGDIPNTEIQ